MKKQPWSTTLFVLIAAVVVQWVPCSGTFGAGGGNNTAAEALSDTVTSNPKTSHEKTVFKNLIGMQFVLIQRGYFIMGSPSKEPGRTIFEEQNEVFIQKPFYIQTTEVTQRQWEEVMGDNPSYFSGCGENCPVENVSWVDVQNFIKKLSQMDSSSKYRLPTEAEWEFVCRSNSSTAFSNGDFINFECTTDSVLNEIAWYRCNSQGKTHPVAQKSPNRWGAYDMHGNVSEWCQDVYVTNYAQILSGDIEDLNILADRVSRNCSYNDTAVSCRSAARVNFQPNVRSSAIGARLIREPLYYKIKMPPNGENLKKVHNNQQEFETVKPNEQAQFGNLEKKNGYTLQVAATKSAKEADRLVAQLERQGYTAYSLKAEIPEKGIWFRIRIGTFDSIEKAQRVHLNMAEDGIQGVILKIRDLD